MGDEMEVMFFSNGNTAVLKDGKQVSELQQGWIILYAKFLESKGIDPTKVSFLLASGHRVEIFRIPNNDFTWRIIDG